MQHHNGPKWQFNLASFLQAVAIFGVLSAAYTYLGFSLATLLILSSLGAMGGYVLFKHIADGLFRIVGAIAGSGLTALIIAENSDMPSIRAPFFVGVIGGLITYATVAM